MPDGILISPSTIPLAGGQKRSVLQLLATPENNNTVVRCVITDVLTGNATIRVATLMVQGNYELYIASVYIRMNFLCYRYLVCCH